MQIDELISRIAPRIQEIEEEMILPEVLSDQRRIAGLAREHRRLKDLLTIHKQIISLRSEISESREALDDPELSELAKEELPALERKLEELDAKLQTLIVPEDPEDARNVVLEIRAGTGGEEAALFGMDLFKMYQRYFELQGWTHKIMNGSFSDLGGVKELLVSVSGNGVYGRMKFESGVHRVQRVPATETSGRTHTSAATVAILPEAEEVDVEIDPSDLKIETFRSSGPGGQHVNKTDSAIRITHAPSGITVSCQDEKSQLKNKNQAMKVLRARLFDIALKEEQAKRSAQRRDMVSTGDRSAKIRTFNFPQSRVTDHRIPITLYRLDEILSGRLDLLLDPLSEYFSRLKLEKLLGQVIKT